MIQKVRFLYKSSIFIQKFDFYLVNDSLNMSVDGSIESEVELLRERVKELENVNSKYQSLSNLLGIRDARVTHLVTMTL